MLSLALAAISLTDFAPIPAQTPAQTPARHPWSNTALSPDKRGDLVLHELTHAEKIQLVHGIGWGISSALTR